MSEKKRLQFEFKINQLKRLDELVEATGASSRAEVIRNALLVYDHIVKWKAEGGEVLFRKEEEHGTRERELLLMAC